MGEGGFGHTSIKSWYPSVATVMSCVKASYTDVSITGKNPGSCVEVWTRTEKGITLGSFTMVLGEEDGNEEEDERGYPFSWQSTRDNAFSLFAINCLRGPLGGL